MSESPNRENTNELENVSKTFFKFIFLIIAVMSISFILVSAYSIKMSLEEVHSGSVTQEVNLLSNGLRELLEAKLSTMRDHARLPAMTNAVMNPQNDHSFLNDLIADLRVQEDKVDFFLLDIDGEVIQRSSDRELSMAKNDTWVSQIIDGRIGYYAAIHNYDFGQRILMAVPIKYNDNPEGILVGLLPFKISSLFENLVKDKLIHATFYSKGILVHEYGSKRQEEGTKKRVELPIISGHMELELYKDKISKALVKLVSTLLFLVLIISFLFYFLFKKLGVTLFIEPQELLKKSRLQALKANKELKVANEELAQFAYRASHDLKAPLITARGYADYIHEDIEDENYGEVKKNALKVSKHVKRLEDLVTDILTLAKADLREETQEEFNLYSVLADIKSELDVTYHDKKVAILINIPEDFMLLSCKMRLRQTLDNIISNGIKYHNPEREERFVKISAFHKDESTEIVIEDNGLGIPDEFHDQLFSMFKRFHPEVSFGSGLGMYTVKKSLDKMGAKITFSSSPAGTTLRIHL